MFLNTTQFAEMQPIEADLIFFKRKNELKEELVKTTKDAKAGNVARAKLLVEDAHQFLKKNVSELSMKDYTDLARLTRGLQLIINKN